MELIGQLASSAPRRRVKWRKARPKAPFVAAESGESQIPATQVEVSLAEAASVALA